MEDFKKDSLKRLEKTNLKLNGHNKQEQNQRLLTSLVLHQHFSSLKIKKKTLQIMPLRLLLSYHLPI